MIATGRGIKAAEAYVELSLLDKTGAGLRNAQSSLRSFGNTVSKVGFAVGGIGAAVAAPLRLAINQASDFEESFNRFGALFGDLKDEAKDFADTLGVSINRSSRSVQNALGLFQGFFGAMELSKEEALRLSKALSVLSFDFASSANLDDIEAATKLMSALAGETEVARRNGLGNISAEGLERELGKAVAKSTELEKVFARVAIIGRTLDSQGVIGDAAKTIDSYANRMRGLQDATKDAAAAIGTALLPSASDFSRRLTIGVRAIGEFAAANQELVRSVSIVATGMTVAGGAFIALGAASFIASAAIGGMRSIILAAVSPVTALSSAMIGLGASAIAAGKSLFTFLGASVIGVVSTIRGAIVGTLSTLLGFITTTSATMLGAITTTSAGSSASLVGLLIPAVGATIAKFIAAAGSVFTFAASLQILPPAIAAVLAQIGALLASIGAIPVLVLAAVAAFLALASAFDFVLSAAENFKANFASIMSTVGQTFKALFQIGITTIHGLATALASGNLERAALIAAAGMKAAFFEAWQSILKVGIDIFGERLISVFATLANVGRLIIRMLRPIGQFVNIINAGIIDGLLLIGKLFGITVDASNALANAAKNATEARDALNKLTGGPISSSELFADIKREGKTLAEELQKSLGLDVGINFPDVRDLQFDLENSLGKLSIPDIDGIKDFEKLSEGIKESIKGLGIGSLFGDVQDKLKQDAAANPLGELNIAELLGQLNKTVKETAAQSSSAVGGFRSAGLLQQVGGRNTTEENIAKATEATAENTAKIADKINNAKPLVFGA